jgi:hypothetical protein
MRASLVRGAVLRPAPSLSRRTAEIGHTRERGRLRSSLVVTQVAVCLVLLVGTGLCVQTLRNLRSEELGLQRNRLLLVWTAPGRSGRPTAELAEVWTRVQERVATLSGVRSVSASTTGFLTGDEIAATPVVVDSDAARREHDLRAVPKTVGPGFFQTIGQSLVHGREFTATDNATAPRVATINTSFARQFFGNEHPVGRTLKAGATPLEIVGVVANAKYLSPREDRHRPMFFYPYAQVPGGHLRRMCLAVRVTGSPSSIAASLRRELATVEPHLHCDTRRGDGDAPGTGAITRDGVDRLFGRGGVAVLRRTLWCTLVHRGSKDE